MHDARERCVGHRGVHAQCCDALAAELRFELGQVVAGALRSWNLAVFERQRLLAIDEDGARQNLDARGIARLAIARAMGRRQLERAEARRHVGFDLVLAAGEEKQKRERGTRDRAA
jgi:hypothetical protein